MHELAADRLNGEGEPTKRRDALPRNRLKLSHLRMIVAIEEHEMISAAAQATNISQPAASRMIAEMEALLDAPLCERLGARGGPTPARGFLRPPVPAALFS